MKTKFVIFCALPIMATAAEVDSKTTEVTQSVDTNGEIRVLVLADPIYRSYRSRSTESYSRIAVTPENLPGTVNQITPKVIEDWGVRSLKETTEAVPGLFNVNDSLAALCYCQFNVRGFANTCAWRDGMRSWGCNLIDVDSLESIDVVKGPISAQYGMTEVGGLVNYVSKGASLDDTGYRNQVTSSVSDRGRWRVAGETGGKVYDNLATYAQVCYSDGETWREIDKRILTASFGLAARFGEDTDLDLRFAYTHEERDMDPGVPLVDGHRVGGIHKFWLDVPGMDGLTLDDIYLVGRVTHRFNDLFTSKSKFNVHQFINEMDALRMPSYNASSGIISARWDSSRVTELEMQFAQDLEMKLGGDSWWENTALIGAEFIDRHYRWHRDWQFGWSGNNDIGWTPSSANPLTGLQHNNCYSMGYYLQDEFVLWDQLHFMGGLRWDWVQQENQGADDTHYTDVFHDHDLTGNIGVLWEATDWLHPYASYSTSYNPQMYGQYDPNGDRPDPEEGKQWEGGVKLPLFEKRFLLTACAFRIDKYNVSRQVTDPLDPLAGYVVTDGHLRSQGFEVSGQGAVTEHLEVLASYACIDGEYIRSKTVEKGSRIENTPKNSGALWSVYHVNGVKSAYGLRFGGGVTAMSSRKTSATKDIWLGGYYTLNAMVGYGWEYMEGKLADLQFNLYNLTDQDYYSCGSDSWAMPGQPFGGQLTIRLTF